MAIVLQPEMNAEPAVERRASPRHCTQYQAECRSLTDAGGPPCIATLHDISVDGIGLVLQYWVAPGATLAVTLLDANGDAGIFNLVRVKRVLLQERKTWSVGGAFVQKIGEEDLKSLLVVQSPLQTSDAPFTDRSGLLPPQRVERTSTPPPARVPEWRKRQIMEQIREQVQHRKSTSTPLPARVPEWRKRQIMERIREQVQHST